MSTVVIRPIKGGGFGPCKASEENVGKKKCNHTLGNDMVVAVKKIAPGTSEIIVDEESINKLSQNEKVDLIKGFVTSLKPITKKQLETVMPLLDE